MVENRDNNTGGHVKRTSDIIKILVAEIRRQGLMDIDDTFAYDIMRAAPMHDLGKIIVENSILNKPGKLTEIISSFRFIEKSGEEEAPEYTKDEDGYILISDSELSGFNLYVPTTFKPDYSSAIVSATAPDGTNVNMTSSAGTNENVNAYMHRRLSELKSFAENIECEYMRDEDGNIIVESESSDRKVIKYTRLDDFGGAINAYAYEYTYEISGEKYYCYQVIAIDGWILNYSGYVFTYTTKYDNHSLHSEELANMIKKVDFE
jgi:hypothetical protein